MIAITVTRRPSRWPSTRRDPETRRWVYRDAGPWALTWACPGCGRDPHDDSAAEPTTEALSRIEADARCCVCRRREPEQLTLITIGA